MYTYIYIHEHIYVSIYIYDIYISDDSSAATARGEVGWTGTKAQKSPCSALHHMN